MEQARIDQFEDKRRRLAEAAQMERSMFEKINQEQKEAEKKERYQQEQQKAAYNTYKTNLTDQIHDKEVYKKSLRQESLEEGKRLRMLQAQELMKLEQIKRSKLSNMKDLGIEQKYRVELEKHKLNDFKLTKF